MHLSFIVGHIPSGDVQIYCMKFINMFKNQKKSSSISPFFFVSLVCTIVSSQSSPFLFFVKYNSNIQIMFISRHTTYINKVQNKREMERNRGENKIYQKIKATLFFSFYVFTFSNAVMRLVEKVYKQKFVTSNIRSYLP